MGTSLQRWLTEHSDGSPRARPSGSCLRKLFHQLWSSNPTRRPTLALHPLLSRCTAPSKAFLLPNFKRQNPRNVRGCKEPDVPLWGWQGGPTSASRMSSSPLFSNVFRLDQDEAAAHSSVTKNPRFRCLRGVGGQQPCSSRNLSESCAWLASDPPTCPIAISGLLQLPNPLTVLKAKAIGSTSALKCLNAIMMIWPNYSPK